MTYYKLSSFSEEDFLSAKVVNGFIYNFQITDELRQPT